jgi:transcriptional accessory protein Tex/SPT6
LRELEYRLGYLRELEDRRGAVLKAIDEQGKLTDALRLAIAQAPTKQELEDLYLPFKQKRRTKGQIAREFGIEPLADKLFADPTLDPLAEAAAFTKPAGAGRRQARRRLFDAASGAGRRARHFERALGRRRRAAAKPARMAVGRRLAEKHAGGRQRRKPPRRGQVSRLF